MVSEKQDRYRENTLKVGNDVHRQTARIAWADVRKVFDRDGHILPVTEWPSDIAVAVSGWWHHPRLFDITSSGIHVVETDVGALEQERRPKFAFLVKSGEPIPCASARAQRPRLAHHRLVRIVRETDPGSGR